MSVNLYVSTTVHIFPKFSTVTFSEYVQPAPSRKSVDKPLCTKDEDLLDDIQEEMEKRRGSQLPTYEKPEVVETKIRDFVDRCKSPVFISLDKVILVPSLSYICFRAVIHSTAHFIYSAYHGKVNTCKQFLEASKARNSLKSVTN